MAFEEHKKRKFQFGNPYADYEYVNKRSRKTLPGLLMALLFGAGMFALGWYRWQEMAAAEQSGDTISLSSIEWGLYKIGGKWCVTGLLFGLGVFFIYVGIKNYLRLEKIKRS